MRKIIALSALRKMGAKRSEKQRIIKKILTHMSEDFLSRGAEKDVLKKYLLICSLKFHSCPLMTGYE